jgi:hypothetical protein
MNTKNLRGGWAFEELMREQVEEEEQANQTNQK